MLVQVTAPRFCAGLVFKDERVEMAAPILGWAIGKTRHELRGYFAGIGWEARVVGNPSET